MNYSNDLDNTLATLRREHRSIELPVSLESDLIEQTRRVRATRRTRIWAGGLGLATAAASILVLAFWHANHRVAPSALPRRTELPIASNTPPVVTTPPEVILRTVHHPATAEHKRIRQAKDGIASEHFFSLPSSEGLPPPSEASLVRMQIQTDTLRQYGLEVSPTAAPRTIVAEFIVGEDGLPRSIRILR